MALCRTCPALDCQSVCERPVQTQKLYTCRATRTWAKVVRRCERNPTSSRSRSPKTNCCAACVKYSIATHHWSSSHLNDQSASAPHGILPHRPILHCQSLLVIGGHAGI